MSDRAGRIGLGGWLQAIANFAILAGLILVGLQIRQATAIAEAQFLSELMDSSARGFETIAGESLPGAWSRAMRNAQPMSDEDLAVIDAFLTREWLNGIRYAALSERGYGPGAPAPATVEKWVEGYLGNETAQRWWRARAEQGMLDLNPSLRDRVTERLESNGPDHAAAHASLLDVLGDTGRAAHLESEFASLVRARYAAWSAGDRKAITEASDGFTIGFGFRTREARGSDPIPKAAIRRAVDGLLDSMVYYRTDVEELHTRAFGNVVVAWGFHTEDFQVRGRAPERIRVRFSTTAIKTADGWRELIGHRDAQPFDERGIYLPVAARPEGRAGH